MKRVLRIEGRLLFFLLRQFGLELYFDFFRKLRRCVAFLFLGLDLFSLERLLLLDFALEIEAVLIHQDKNLSVIITQSTNRKILI